MYRYLSGSLIDVDTLPAVMRTAAADRIAGFLRALHRLQPPAAIASLLPREDARTVAEECLSLSEREVFPKLENAHVHTLREHFRKYLDANENFTFEPVVLHADLSREHLLTAGDAVVGIIDFGDVNWGDRDYDFHYLLLDFGKPFALDVARRYGHPNPDRLLSKLRYFGMADQIGTTLEDPRRPIPGQMDEAWQRLKQLV